MAVSMMQYTAPTTPSNISIGYIPPGGTMIITSTETAADVYLGTSNTVTAATGVPLVVNMPVVISLAGSASGVTIYACAGTGTHVVGAIIINAS